ncbi:rho guanine nucleotide exchange factor 2-like isoform X1 [Polyodon spathula]|uniref:rho guanine nucleotide exchange factor 2-like isoform X1 n=1 Tax=Polyodon spathula TaxID=7913 RepID=UPI001B7E9939|nr:rho guanine nucleotide exchange factor 2-like isoform X1 [Polyodon spathula]
MMCVSVSCWLCLSLSLSLSLILLSCFAACNVTIHNRCRDTLPNCTKMKQKQQKLALVRNSSAIQNVALRNKSPMNVRERPSSAIYPSDSLRQSLLGSRRVRSGLLSKSVSTNNIAGNLNDDAPLGLRRILSQSTDSLNFRNRAMSIESLNDEGEQFYSQMLSELEAEEEDFKADSWSLAVDTNFLQQQRKDVMKRQDVIYELIQTELHHVRTLRIMAEVFRRGMLEELQVEPALVHAVFPCLDELTDIHVNFLSQLLRRRKESLAPGSQRNFIITQLGDILRSQFSGCSADRMRKAYVEFCSRHNKSVKQYKELLARDKRFQQFIRRVSRGSLLRRHGVQECILLVTQRVTKYPVLVDRILHNTKGNEEESTALKEALVLIRELLSSVDQEVHDLERTQRLQEIYSRLDPRAETSVQGNQAETMGLGSGAFRSGEIMRRRLMHEGPLLWKTGSRFKDVQVLLMTDILVFLQEKDQKYTFPILDKPPVVSLKNLIVRDIANQERGMFLICDSTPPVMYEIHAASREDRNTWMKLIKQTVSSCPCPEEFPLIETEDEALLRKLRGAIQQKDRELVELLEERVSLFSEVLEVQAGEGVSLCINTRNLFRAETPEAPRGEKLIIEAIREVERLGELLVGTGVELTVTGDQNHSIHRGEPEGQASLAPNGEEVSVNGTHEFCRTDSNPEHRDRNGNRMQENSSSEVLFQGLVNLNVKLHALQAAVLQQDSLVELCLRGCSLPGGVAGREKGRDKLSRSLSRDGGLDAALGGGTELVLLQRQHSLIQEELSRTRGSEARLRDSERARAENERQLRELREHSAALQAKLDILQAQEADKRPRHSRQNSLPSEGELRQGRAGQAARRGSEGDDVTGAPLPSDQTDQSQRVQEDCSDPEVNSEDEEEADELSTGSSSPREFHGMHDIPEESECGAEQREAGPD